MFHEKIIIEKMIFKISIEYKLKMSVFFCFVFLLTDYEIKKLNLLSYYFSFIDKISNYC